MLLCATVPRPTVSCLRFSLSLTLLSQYLFPRSMQLSAKTRSLINVRIQCSTIIVTTDDDIDNDKNDEIFDDHQDDADEWQKNVRL